MARGYGVTRNNASYSGKERRVVDFFDTKGLTIVVVIGTHLYRVLTSMSTITLTYARR